MNNFAPYPFLRLSPVFILGIVVFHYLSEYLNITLVVPFALIVVYGLLSLANSMKFKAIIGLLGVCIIFLFGYFRLQFFKDDLRADHLINHQDTIEAYEAIVVDGPDLKSNSIKVVVQLTKVHNNLTDPFQRTAKINLYLDKEKGADLNYGDVLLVHGEPERMQGPQNPGEFDYRNYLVYNNIFHQHFAGDAFAVIGHQPISKIIDLSLKLRKQCTDLITDLLPNDEVRGVVLALVIGVKDDLDSEVLKAYSAAGATHVLAVSGLHVGIIYGLVLLIFKRLRLTGNKARWYLAVVSLLILWTYAFVTGLSPSVLRAVCMFSFIAIGKATKRNTNIYNTLAASAFVLLWYNPYLIMSVGFQLSYLAVFGIVYLQPRFYELLTFKNGMLNWAWGITCVSVAAQIATGPLSMLYFHQFPAYFFISNLFIIPAALAILVVGLGLLSLGWLPLVGTAIAWILTQFVLLVNWMVFQVEKIPGSVIEGIQVKTYETWMVYLSIIFTIYFFAKKRFNYLIAAVTIALFFGLSQVVDRSRYNQQSSLSFFNVRNASVVDFKVGAQARLLGDSAFINDSEKLRFSIQPKRLVSFQDIHIKNDDLELASQVLGVGELISFQGNTYLFLKGKAIGDVRMKSKIHVNTIIVSDHAVSNLKQLTDLFEFDRLIIDKSNRKYLADRLLSQAEILNLEVHSIYEEGFLELNANE